MDSSTSMDYNIRHATREELYTSFGKRMEYLKAFVGFTDDDVFIFNKGAKYLKAAIPTLTHRLYERMLEFDITARALRTRTTTSDVHVEDLFTIDSPHLEYWEYLDKVG
ncbi:Protoglobin-domain-containing protein [Aspergillus ambiguus]|uniref:protoglobin family protein n=1 Tax=Aspergillus ambiguus TaxID=176160 RepID=UPI003CCCB407